MSFIAEQPEVQEVCRVCSSQSCSRSKTGSGIKGGKLSSLSPSIHNFILLSITSFLSKGSSRINHTVWFRQSVSSFLPSLFSSPFKLYAWYQGTVFIPTNEAFKLLPGDKMDKAISADLERWDCGTLCCKQIYHHCGLKIFITVTDGLLLWSLLENSDTVKLLKHIVKVKLPIRILGLHFLDQSVQSDDIRIQQPQNDAGVYIDIFLLYLGQLL